MFKQFFGMLILLLLLTPINIFTGEKLLQETEEAASLLTQGLASQYCTHSLN